MKNAPPPKTRHSFCFHCPRCGWELPPWIADLHAMPNVKLFLAILYEHKGEIVPYALFPALFNNERLWFFAYEARTAIRKLPWAIITHHKVGYLLKELKMNP